MVNYDERTDVAFPDKAELIGNVRPGSPKVRKYHETVQELIKDVEQFEQLQQWTVLLDVSGSMNDVYMEKDVKNALLKLFDMGAISLDVYKFTTGLTENPQVSRNDVKTGLRTTNGTNAEAAIKELCDRYDTPENLLVVTDLDDIPSDSLPKEPENMCSIENAVRE